MLFDDASVVSEDGSDIHLGSKSSSSGVSLKEWAGLMVGLGGMSVLNLDGGFSTSIHIALDGQRLDVHPHGATINAVLAQPIVALITQ